MFNLRARASALLFIIFICGAWNCLHIINSHVHHHHIHTSSIYIHYIPTHMYKYITERAAAAHNIPKVIINSQFALTFNAFDTIYRSVVVVAVRWRPILSMRRISCCPAHRARSPHNACIINFIHHTHIIRTHNRFTWSVLCVLYVFF